MMYKLGLISNPNVLFYYFLNLLFFSIIYCSFFLFLQFFYLYPCSDDIVHIVVTVVQTCLQFCTTHVHDRHVCTVCKHNK